MASYGWGGRQVANLRNQVISTYGTTCHICGRPIDLSISRTEPGGYTLDHVIPKSLGGQHTLANLRPAHRRCNMARQNKPISRPEETRKKRLVAAWPGLADQPAEPVEQSKPSGLAVF
nr:MAG TPA: HNH nuclease [Caudoviricetes sp.]